MSAESIGSYRILGELGRGGMGVVYHAEDPAIGRPVAIKVIRVESASTADESAQLRQRLVREATAAGRLSHQGIVTVYQLGEDGQSVFVVMEFVRGMTLADLAAKRTIDRPTALDMLRQIAEALDYAHRAGVVHRDVKPANILVREDGCVKIADFGIAKMLEEAAGGLTRTGMSIGSPSWMSPEQVRGAQVDGRSDQFSLGIIAYSLLTGRQPFPGDSAHTIMYQIVNTDPLATQPPDPSLPPRVTAALARALAKDPAMRFPTCAAFVRELAAGLPPTPLTETLVSPVAGSAPPRIPSAPPPMPGAPPRLPNTPAPLPGGRKSPLLPVLIPLLLCVAVVCAWWVVRKSHNGGLLSGGASAPGTNASAPAEQPLIKAIAEGRLDDARNLIARGADVNAANPDGKTALMQAAEGSGYLPNNASAVALLLDKGANVNAQDHRGWTALYRAIAEGKQDAVRILLAHKADPNAKASDGSTPVMGAVIYGRVDLLKLLLENGGQPDIADAQSNTPLMVASEGTGYLPNNVPLVETLLQRNARVDAQDARGRTPLYRASAEGKTDAVQLLIANKSPVNARAGDGTTPLMEAVTYNRMPVLEMLLKAGADVNQADSSGNTPLMIASEGNGYLQNNAPMVSALLTAGATVDTQDARGRSALYRASSEGKEEAMRLLLDKKANPNLKASDGTAPLWSAVTFGHTAAATLLLERGAQVDAADANGSTPLMIVAEGNGNNTRLAGELIPLLLSHGAKPGLTDNQGRTALARATTNKNTAAIELLKQQR